MSVTVLRTPLVALLTVGDGTDPADRWHDLDSLDQGQAIAVAIEFGFIDEGAPDEENYYFTRRGDTVRRHLLDLAA